MDNLIRRLVTKCCFWVTSFYMNGHSEICNETMSAMSPMSPMTNPTSTSTSLSIWWKIVSLPYILILYAWSYTIAVFTTGVKTFYEKHLLKMFIWLKSYMLVDTLSFSCKNFVVFCCVRQCNNDSLSLQMAKSSNRIRL